MKFFKYLFRLLLIFILIIITVWGVYAAFPLKYTNTIRSEAAAQGVDKYLIAALIRAESNFDSEAVSAANAKGVMQLTDETAAFCASNMGLDVSGDNIFDPDINIKLGVCYLKRMLDMYSGDEDLAIAAYNAGEGRVKEWLSNPEYSGDGKKLDDIPYEETKNHVAKIRMYKKIYAFLYPNL